MIVLSKRVLLTASIGLAASLSFAQSIDEGIQYEDSHKFSKAREVYNALMQSNPKDADNFFYLGSTYLTQFEPNFTLAQEQFTKGLEVSSKSHLNKIGLASVKLGKGNKTAIAEIQEIVKASREKKPEVLYRAAQALSMYEENNAPDLAIEYLNKAIEISKKGVPAYYYYSLGDAYRLKKDPGKAMSAYDKALLVAKNKSSVYTRMGTLWMAAQQWQLAKENITKAITSDQTYAPAYKAKAAFDIRYQDNKAATQDLLNYTKYADDDPYTQLEIAKLFFVNGDYANARQVLDKVYDKVQDDIKLKLRAYLDYGEGNYEEARKNMESFQGKVEKERVKPADYGLLGLIDAALASKETDEAKKAQLLSEAYKKIDIAKSAKDKTLKWDEELAKVEGFKIPTQADAEAGKITPEIQTLDQKVKQNPNDTDTLFKLALAYQNEKNWAGAILTWKKITDLLPDWGPGYYSQGYAYQQIQNNPMARIAYENYIAKIKPEEIKDNKESLAYACFAVAFMVKDKEPDKAKDYVAKSLELNPTYEDAINLQKALSQK